MKRRFIEFLVLLTVAIGAGPVGAAIWQWSTTAASNATADPTINWSSGIAPSTITPNGRSMMAAVAAWRTDISAATATTGTSTAYAFTSSQGSFTATSTRDGFMIGFIPNVTNGAGGVTINVDAAGAKPLRAVTATALSAGALVAGSKYTAAYKFSTDEWLLFNSYPSQFEVPLGAVIPYTGASAPNANFVIPIGQCISRTTYATYFAMVSTTFGACDGVTTFGVPDLRGRGLWGHDAMGGSTANRVNAVGCSSTAFNAIGEVCGVQVRTISAANLPALSGNTATIGATNFLVGSGGTFATSGSGVPIPSDSGTNFLSVTVNTGSANTALQMPPPIMGLNMILRVL